jgi:hypothetical protein
MNRVYYVNAYEVTRHYGGPEEGGWWYNLNTPIASVPIMASNENDKRIKQQIKELEKIFSDRVHGDIYSVCGGKEITVCVEDKFAVVWW